MVVEGSRPIWRNQSRLGQVARFLSTMEGICKLSEQHCNQQGLASNQAQLQGAPGGRRSRYTLGEGVGWQPEAPDMTPFFFPSLPPFCTTMGVAHISMHLPTDQGFPLVIHGPSFVTLVAWE